MSEETKAQMEAWKLIRKLQEEVAELKKKIAQMEEDALDQKIEREFHDS